jgi:hypothetical protein
MFIGLNPSTANETSDDPTIRRIKSMAVKWGYGGVYMLNLFAFVSSNPKVLLHRTHEKIGYHNDRFLKEFAERSWTIVFAWGAFKEAKERAIDVIEMFPKAKALAINLDGSPKHPLYVKSDVVPVQYYHPLPATSNQQPVTQKGGQS